MAKRLSRRDYGPGDHFARFPPPYTDLADVYTNFPFTSGASFFADDARFIFPNETMPGTNVSIEISISHGFDPAADHLGLYGGG